MDDADIVYEEMAEGGITRYLAVFQCQQAPLLGPIRSVRWDDWNVLQQYGHAELAYSGGITYWMNEAASLPFIYNANGSEYPTANAFSLQLEHPAGRPGRTLQLLLLDRCAVEAVPQGDRSPTATVQVLQGAACRSHTGLGGLDRLLGRITRRLAVERIRERVAAVLRHSG